MISGRRPLSIRLFAFAWLAQLVIFLLHDLGRMESHKAMLVAQFPQIEWDGPATVVAIGVRAGVALLPLGLIYARAVNFARWAAALLVLAKLYAVPEGITASLDGNILAAGWLAGMLVAVLAVWFLFRPDARYWFASKGGTWAKDANRFE